MTTHYNSNFFATDRVVGNSAWTQRMRRRVTQVANYRYRILITGPTGTGKQLLARAVHTHSPRSDRPFIPVDCAAIPVALFTSHLMGHVAGAFAGANAAALGCVRAADGGTVLLHEVGALDADCQNQLLRALQQHAVTPVGSRRNVPVNVRLIATTSHDLEERVRAGSFHPDLFYKLNVLPIRTMPLRDRVADILPLSEHFLAKLTVEGGLPAKRLSSDAVEFLQSYGWPGNVRQLRAAIERALLMSSANTIDAHVLQTVISDRRNPGKPRKSDLTVLAAESRANASIGCWSSLATVEADHIRRTLEQTFGDLLTAAQMLDVDRDQLEQKIKKYNIVVPLATYTRC